MTVEVLLEITSGESWAFGAAGLVRQTIEETIDVAAPELAGYSGDVEIGVLLADDATLKALNRDHRGIDKPTNVLSFPISRSIPANSDLPILLGDLAISCETIVIEATRDAKSTDHHLRHMLVHGVLHLLGFDHETDATADAMEALEVDILKPLGVPNPYYSDQSEGDVSDHDRRS